MEKFLELTPPPPPLLYSFSSLASTLSATPSKLLSSLNLTGKAGSSADLSLSKSNSCCTLSFCHIGGGSVLLKDSRLSFFPSLVFTVSSDAKLRCWDLLSSQIVATHTMSSSSPTPKVSLTDYGKRVKSGGAGASSNFVSVVAVQSEFGEEGRVAAKVFLVYYSPVFFGFSLVEVWIAEMFTRINPQHLPILSSFIVAAFGSDNDANFL